MRPCSICGSGFGTSDKRRPRSRWAHRPVALERLPEGLTEGGPHFWQKNTPASYPAWVPRAELATETGKPVSYALVNTEEALLYLVNQGTLTFHPWLSRTAGLDRPDFVVFDLDRGGAALADVVAVARAVKAELDAGVGVLRAIDAVGVDAYRPESGPAYAAPRAMKAQFKEEQQEVLLEGSGATWGGQWVPGDAPSQVLTWAVQALAKAGTLSIIGVYPETMTRFPIGMAMMKNLTLQMGNCPHRKYIPRLIEAVVAGKADPLKVLTEVEPITDAIAAYKAFDLRKSGWVKVELKPGAAQK